MSLSKADIQQIIPHREPFVLVDGIVELEQGRSATAIVNDPGAYGIFAQLRSKDRGPEARALVDTIRLDASGIRAEGTIEDVAALQPLFEGHFPNRPILPGVLMLEALAEVAHCHLVQTGPFLSGAYLKRVNGLRMRRVVVPGDRLELSAESDPAGEAWVRATVDGQTAAEGRLVFVPQDQLAPPTGGQSRLPGQATLPGALLIEALAEVGAVAALAGTEHQGEIAFMASIDAWEFHMPVYGGMQLTLQASLTHMRGTFGRGRFSALSNGATVAAGNLTFSLG
jgi:3-hydroxymyristoyl/3-hydroxydecanoyl-(acyl carrier protein) dehydratase